MLETSESLFQKLVLVAIIDALCHHLPGFSDDLVKHIRESESMLMNRIPEKVPDEVMHDTSLLLIKLRNRLSQS